MGRTRRLPTVTTACLNTFEPSAALKSSGSAASGSPPLMTTATKNSLQFWMYGVSPIWGQTHRNLLKHTAQANTPVETVSRVWLAEKDVCKLGLRIADQNTPRVASPFGVLVSGDATSDPSMLSIEAFQTQRIPLTLGGSLPVACVARPLTQLMVSAPSEFPSLYWGHRAEFLAAGAEVLPGAREVECVNSQGTPFSLFNAGQTTKPDFFTANTCVACPQYLLPEMKFEYTALHLYWDVVRRGRVNCSNQWFTGELIRANSIRMKHKSRSVCGRFFAGDCVDVKDGHELFVKISIEKEKRKKTA